MNRDPCVQNGLQWANIHSIVLANPKAQYHIGDDLNFTFRYQDRDSDASVEWYLDTDTNPYNVPAATLGTPQPLSTTGNNVVTGTATRSTSGALAGTYRCYAKITSANSGEPRYEYATNVVNLIAATVVSDPPIVTTVSPNSLPGLPLPQTQLLTVTGTGFLPESRLEFFDGTTTNPNRTPIYDSPTQLRYNIKVGNVSANWTVKVFNGSLESNPGSFTVTATPDSTAPPAPLNVTGAFAGGVNDDFYYVDWTNPNDASGLAKVWWKLGSPPTSPGDGVGLELPLFKPLPVSTLTTNPQTLYVWLEDGAGNKNHNNRAEVLLFRTTGAPLIVTSPGDRTVPEGASAVFTAAAGGEEPLHYQWQRNEADIPGATAPTYATPPLALGDSGAQFRVVVTNIFGAVTSTVATVTVTPANVITWTGASGDSNWLTANNWSPAIVPGAGDSAVVNLGTVIVPASASFAVLNVNGGRLNGTFNVVGTMNWSSGFVDAAVTVTSGSVLNLTDGGFKGLGGTLVNAGSVNLAAGSLIGPKTSTPGLAVTNRPGGVMRFSETSGIGNTGGVIGYIGTFPTFHNAGALYIDAGSTNVSLMVSNFVNVGIVYVDTGTSSLRHGMTCSGVLNVAFGSTLDLGGGISVFLPGSVSSGAGRVLLAGEINGTLVGQNFQVNGPTVFGALKVTGSFTIAGKLDWLAGYVDAQVAVANGGVVNLTGGGHRGLGGTLVNAGSVNVAAGNYVAAKATGSITNLAGGVIDLSEGSALGGGNLIGGEYGPWIATLENIGLLRVTAGTSNAWLRANAFLNTGTVNVRSGNLNVGGGISNAGTLIVEAGSTLTLGTGRSVFLPGSVSSGAGRVLLAGEINGTLVGQNFQVNGPTVFGALPVTGSFTIAGKLDWLAGYVDAQVTVANGGVVNLTGGGYRGLGGTLVNAGSVNVAAGNYATAKATGFGGQSIGSITNLAGGVIELGEGSALGPGGGGGVIGGEYGAGIATLENIGLLRVTAGTSNAWLTANAFLNTGTVNVRSGSLSVGGNLTGEGEIHLTIGGVVAGVDFASVTVSGAANLAGTLVVDFLNGFVPGFGNEFRVLQYGSRTGSFTSIMGLQPPGGVPLTPIYGGNALTLVAGTPTGAGQPNSFDLINSSATNFQVRLNGEPGRNYRLQGSSDLQGWTDLLITNTPTGLLYFTDQVTAQSPQRFYRVVSP